MPINKMPKARTEEFNVVGCSSCKLFCTKGEFAECNYYSPRGESFKRGRQYEKPAFCEIFKITLHFQVK